MHHIPSLMTYPPRAGNRLVPLRLASDVWSREQDRAGGVASQVSRKATEQDPIEYATARRRDEQVDVRLDRPVTHLGGRVTIEQHDIRAGMICCGFIEPLPGAGSNFTGIRKPHGTMAGDHHRRGNDVDQAETGGTQRPMQPPSFLQSHRGRFGVVDADRDVFEDLVHADSVAEPMGCSIGDSPNLIFGKTTIPEQPFRPADVGDYSDGADT